MPTDCEYTRRINKVIDHLRANLDRPVKLEELAGIACFSEYHFHRIFGSLTGETVHGLTQRLRLEKAARLLRYSKRRVTDIALDCGFSSSATFSRAFRAGFQTSPSAFRKDGKIKKRKICKELFPSEQYILPMSLEEKAANFPVSFRDAPERHIAYLRVVDAFQQTKVLVAFEKMLNWAESRGLLEATTLFGMSADDPHVTPKHLYRYEVCLASTQPFPQDEAMLTTTMPAMRYAVTRVSGDLRRVATAWDYLYRGWLVRSRYEPEHAPALEIFLNKKKATDWSHFELELCLPVRKIA